MISVYSEEVSQSWFWYLPSLGKTTHPEVQLTIMCLICGPIVHLSLEASLQLVRIYQWKNKIKIAINFHRDAITGDMVIASCSDVFAEWGIVLNSFFIIILSLLGGIPQAAALCCNLTHQTCGDKSRTQMPSVWKHGTSKITTERERERGRQKVQMVHLSTHQCHNWAVREDE